MNKINNRCQQDGNQKFINIINRSYGDKQTKRPYKVALLIIDSATYIKSNKQYNIAVNELRNKRRAGSP